MNTILKGLGSLCCVVAVSSRGVANATRYILAFAALMLCGGAWAEKSISINFCQNDGPVTTEQETLIGTIPVDAWNNTSTEANAANTEVKSPDNGGYNVASLKVYDGSSASADSTKAARFGVQGMNNVWYDKTSGTTLNGSFLYQGLCHRSGDNKEANILYTNTGSDFACYDVIVYLTAANANSKMPSNFSPISINGYWYKGDTTAGDTKTVRCESTDTWGSTPVTSSNWKQLGVNTLRVNGLHGSLRIYKAAQSDCGIAAIQIVENTTASALTDKRVISIDLQSAKSSGGNMSGSAIYGMEGVPADSWVNDGCAYANNDANKDEDIAVTLKEYNGTLASPTTTDVKNAMLHEKVNNAYYWTTATDPFLKAYCDDSPANVYVRNVPYSKYDVIVYFATDTADRYFGPVTVNGVSYKWSEGAAKVVSSSSSTADTRWGYSQCKTSIYGVNTIRINNQTAADLSIMGGNNANTARGGIAAIQIVAQGEDRPVEVFEPTPGNTLIGSSDFVDTGVQIANLNLLSLSRITGVLGGASVNSQKYKTAIGYNTQKIGDVVYTEFQIKDGSYIKAVLAALKVENGTVRIKTVKTSYCDTTASSVIGTPLMTVDSSGNVSGSNLGDPVAANSTSGYGLRQIRIDSTGRVILDNTNDGTITGSGGWNLSKLLIPATTSLPSGTHVTVKSISLAGMSESNGSYATNIKVGDTVSSAAVVDTRNPWPMGTDSFKVTYVFESGVDVVVGTESNIIACNSSGTETTTRLKSSNAFTSGNTYITFTNTANWPMYEIVTPAPTATISGTGNNFSTINWNGGIIANANIATLTINEGAELVLDTAISAKLVRVVGTGDLALTGTSLDAENFAKLDLSGFAGKRIFRNTSFIPTSAPTEGVTYRFEGTTALSALPYETTEVKGTVEVARPVTATGVIGMSQKKANYIFEGNFSATRLLTGNSNGAVQTITQKSGTITLSKELDRDPSTMDNQEGPVLFAHWPNAKTTYNFVGGEIDAHTGTVGFGRDSSVDMTIGGGSATATFKAMGISYNNRVHASSLKVLENGVLELGKWGLYFKDGKTLTLAGGTVRSIENNLIIDTANPITLKDGTETTLDVASGKTMTLNATFTGTGTLKKTGAGTLVIHNLRDFSKLTVEEGDVKTAITDNENLIQGSITIQGLGDDVKIPVVMPDGTEIQVGNGTTPITPVVKNTAALYDWTFLYDRNLASTGKNTNSLHWDTGYSQSNGFTDNHLAIKTPATPYSDFTVSYPTTWTCLVAGVVPNVNKGVLIAFGTRDGGLIGLAAGTSPNEVILVRTTGNSAYSVIGNPMTVTNARETRHTYGFVKTATSIIVYLDGKYWAEQAVSNVSFGSSLQVGSVHGGVGSTGLVKPTDTTAANSTISAVRIFDCQLSEKAIKAFADEFPYTSLNGTATRTITEDDDWVKTDAWTLTSKDGTVTQADKPNENQTVVLTTEGNVTVANNLTAPASYEKLTINGTGTVTFTADVAETTANMIKAGQIEVNTTVKIEHGALDFTGGPTELGDNGKIIFDFSSLTGALILNQPVDLQLTGVIASNNEKIQLLKPDYPSYITGGLVYEGGSYYFRAKRNTTEIYWKEGTGTNNNTWDANVTFYADEAKTAATTRTADDTVVFNETTAVYVSKDYAPADPLKIKVTNNATVTFGHDDWESNGNKNMPNGSMITIDSGARVLFGFWNNDHHDNAILGDLTLNGEGTWGQAEKTGGIRIEGTIGGTAKLTGNGKLIYDQRVPSDAVQTSLQANTWNGSVYLKKSFRKTDSESATGGYTCPNFNINAYGNASSTVITTGNVGWLANGGDFGPTVELVDANDEPALWIGDSSNGYNYGLKVTGSGTLKVNSRAGSTANILLKSVEGFTGNIDAANLRVTIGDSGTAANDGKIVVNSGKTVTIGSGKIWTSVGGVEVAGTITGSGTIAGNLVLTATASKATVASATGTVTTTVDGYSVVYNEVGLAKVYELMQNGGVPPEIVIPQGTTEVSLVPGQEATYTGTAPTTITVKIPSATGSGSAYDVTDYCTVTTADGTITTTLKDDQTTQPAVTTMAAPTEESTDKVQFTITNPIPGLFYAVSSCDTPDGTFESATGSGDQATSGEAKTVSIPMTFTGDNKVKYYKVSVKATK
ncbi:MAG: hypothetical protein MJ109_01330 [Kiritimatiellae bacterium]|nr:hypothetical protein [Kiritimatiellia bacterium]